MIILVVRSRVWHMESSSINPLNKAVNVKLAYMSVCSMCAKGQAQRGCFSVESCISDHVQVLLSLQPKTHLVSTQVRKNLRNSMGSICLYEDFKSHFVIIYKSFLRISHFLKRKKHIQLA